MSFIVSYHDMVDPVTDTPHQNKILNGAMRGSIARVLGTMIESKKIKLQQYPGRQFDYNCKQYENNLRLSSRIFLVGQRLYQLNVVSHEDDFDERAAKKFFQSFKLVAADLDDVQQPNSDSDRTGVSAKDDQQ
jgi:hypothetical protein